MTAALNLAVGIGVYRLLARPDEHIAAHAKEKVVMTPGNVPSTLTYPSLLLVGFALSATS